MAGGKRTELFAYRALLLRLSLDEDTCDVPSQPRELLQVLERHHRDIRL
jgi:hypothetical protein